MTHRRLIGGGMGNQLFEGFEEGNILSLGDMGLIRTQDQAFAGLWSATPTEPGHRIAMAGRLFGDAKEITVSSMVRHPGQLGHGVSLFVPSSVGSAYYHLILHASSPSLRLRTIRGGGEIATAVVTIAAGTWYGMSLTWLHGGFLTGRLFDAAGNLLAQCGAENVLYNTGHAGLSSYRAGVYFDNWRVQWK